MTIVICPGVHAPSLTEAFIAALNLPFTPRQLHSGHCSNLGFDPSSLVVLPTQQIPPYSPLEVLQFLEQHCSPIQPIFIISFSAGVVGSMGAAWLWEQKGRPVQALLALDGWGVPLVGHWPIYRFSHDQFTHWSSQLLGATSTSFYADPAVEHLEFWRSPDQVRGWRITPADRQQTTLKACIHQLLSEHRGTTFDSL